MRAALRSRDGMAMGSATMLWTGIFALDSALVLEVADRGPGITSGQEQRLFENLVQAEPHQRHGSGLGLAICKGMVELHGDRIDADNRADGSGAAFRFTLPCLDR
jgi:two-component system sensor histidine kinase KdpD